MCNFCYFLLALLKFFYYVYFFNKNQLKTMKLIKISKKKLEQPLEFTDKDIYSCSFILKESSKALKMFVKHLTEMNKDEFAIEVIANRTNIVDRNKRYIVLKDGTIYLFVHDINWEAIVLCYILKHTVPNQRNNSFEETLKFLEIKRIRRGLFFNEVNKLKRAIIDYGEQEERISLDFINYYRLEKTFKDRKICGVVRDDEAQRLILTFDDVKLGNEKEGFLLYKKIVLYISDWAIEKFDIEFNNFNYSSDIEGAEELILHPYIKPPYMFNAILTWIDKHDYDGFAETIIDLTTNYKPESGIMPIRNIIHTYNKLKKIWDDKQSKEETNVHPTK